MLHGGVNWRAKRGCWKFLPTMGFGAEEIVGSKGAREQNVIRAETYNVVGGY